MLIRYSDSNYYLNFLIHQKELKIYNINLILHHESRKEKNKTFFIVIYLLWNIITIHNIIYWIILKFRLQFLKYDNVNFAKHVVSISTWYQLLHDFLTCHSNKNITYLLIQFSITLDYIRNFINLIEISICNKTKISFKALSLIINKK